MRLWAGAHLLHSNLSSGWASTAEAYFLTVLEARNPRTRCGQVDFLSEALLLGVQVAAVSRVLTWPSVRGHPCVRVPQCFLLKGTPVSLDQGPPVDLI